MPVIAGGAAASIGLARVISATPAHSTAARNISRVRVQEERIPLSAIAFSHLGRCARIRGGVVAVAQPG